MDELDTEEKGFYGLPATKTDEEIREYAKNCIAVYKRECMNWVNEDLLLYFRKDFDGFDLDVFKKIDAETRKCIRDHLRKHCVHISHEAIISNDLESILKEDFPWPSNARYGPEPDEKPGLINLVVKSPTTKQSSKEADKNEIRERNLHQVTRMMMTPSTLRLLVTHNTRLLLVICYISNDEGVCNEYR